jgi:hypothetical protein
MACKLDSSPLNGGNRGSNPRGDAKKIRHLANFLREIPMKDALQKPDLVVPAQAGIETIQIITGSPPSRG